MSAAKYGAATRLSVNFVTHLLTATHLQELQGRVSISPTTTSKSFLATTRTHTPRFLCFRSCAIVKYLRRHSATYLFTSKTQHWLNKAELFSATLFYSLTMPNFSITPLPLRETTLCDCRWQHTLWIIRIWEMRLFKTQQSTRFPLQTQNQILHPHLSLTPSYQWKTQWHHLNSTEWPSFWFRRARASVRCCWEF